jgi:hypothetical protein
MGGACSVHTKMRNLYKIFVGKPEGKRPPLIKYTSDIPVSTLNSIMANENNIQQQGGSSEPSRTTNFILLTFKMISHLGSLYSLVPWKNL